MRKKYFNVVLSVLLILVCLISDFSTMFVHAESDATARQKAYIEFASNRASVTDQEVSSLTKDEMRILGVFLSNFYVPWGTQLVQTDDDDATREQMVEILTDSLKFDETLAGDLVDATFQMSIDSSERLYARLNFIEYELDDEGNKIVAEDSNGNEIRNYGYSKGYTVSYYDLLSLFDDETEDIIKRDRYVDSSWNEVEEDEAEYLLEYDSISLVTEDGKEVFCLDDEYNADEIALAACLQNLNMNKGMGYNIFALSEDICYNYSGDAQLEALVDSLSSSSYMYNISCLGWGLYVDCFGNIIVDTGVNRQYILMPGCMNPYTWKKDGCEVGECLPINNLAFMSLSSEGDKIASLSNWQNPSGEQVEAYTIDVGTHSDNADLEYMRMYRGTTDWEFEETWWGRVTDLFSDDTSDTVAEILLDEYNDGGHLFGLEPDSGDGFNCLGTGDALDDILGTFQIEKSYVIEDFILFDNLNEFGNDTPMVANAYGIFADASCTPLVTSSDIGSFNNYLFDPGENTLVKMNSEDQKKFIAGIYCAYVFAYFEIDGVEHGGHVNFRFCPDNLPDISSGFIELTDTSLLDMQEDVLVMSYNILHPNEGIEYVAKLATSKLEGILLGWHGDLVGNVHTGSTTGATKYIGTSSYMTTPEISDVSWLNSLFSLYTSNIAYILMVILIVMLIYAISGYIGWQRALVNTACFGFCIYALPMLISGGISVANNFTDSLYNNKFTYWAIVQHQAYQEDLDRAVEQSNYNDYMVTLFSQQGFSYDSHVVNLRWMCPKKDNYLVNIEREFYESTNSSSMTKLLRGVLNNQLSGEDYSDSANKTYLYRSYTDISAYAQHIYENIGVHGHHNVNGVDVLYQIEGYNGVSLQDYFIGYTSSTGLVANATEISGDLDRSENLGFNYNTYLDEMNNTRFYYFNRSSKISNATNDNLSTVGTEYDELGVPTSEFNFTVADYNSINLMPAEKTSLGVFAIYSESPYYYLNWNVRDQLYSSGVTGDYTIKTLLLSEKDGINSYFYNTNDSLKDTDSYGQLRDYMDMRSLFTIVIPYLKACNDKVIEFDEVYGLSMIGDYEVRYTTDENGVMTLDIPSGLRTLTEENKDDYYSFWHDVQVSNLFNMYTPWVDSLYACSYANAEKLEVAGVTYVIEDPLNPASYPADRPMIFSESERLYYGLTYADLTEVEKKILNVNENCYNELITLMNYYTFDEEVLISALAMMETFEFNKEFSETPLIGDSNVLYPQGFELKNFSFDAYFRLILSETTGIDLNSSKSIYETVVEDTSIFTAILILLVDLTAVWFVPFLRLAIVVLLFLMAIITVMSSCISGKDGENLDFKALIKSIGKSVVSPLVKFVSMTVFCAWIISLFVSSGYTGITGKLDYTISFGDPVLAMFAVLVVNSSLIVVYVSILVKMFKDGKVQVKSIGNSVTQVGAGLAALGTGAIVSKSAETKMGDISAPSSSSSGGGASSNIKPKLKVRNSLNSGAGRNSASERLAKQELKDRKEGKNDSKVSNSSSESLSGSSIPSTMSKAKSKFNDTKLGHNIQQNKELKKFEKDYAKEIKDSREKERLSKRFDEKGMKAIDRVEKKVARRDAQRAKVNEGLSKIKTSMPIVNSSKSSKPSKAPKTSKSPKIKK